MLTTARRLRVRVLTDALREPEHASQWMVKAVALGGRRHNRSPLAFPEYECAYLRVCRRGVIFAASCPSCLSLQHQGPDKTFDGQKTMEISQ